MLSDRAIDDVKAMPRETATRVSDETSKRRIGRDTILLNLTRLIVLAAVVIAWEVTSGRWVDSIWIGSPSGIGSVLREWLQDAPAGQSFLQSTVFANLAVTLEEALYGFLIGSAVGIGLGMLLGQLRTLGQVFSPFIVAIYTIPRIALAPLFILWFGIGTTSKVAFSAMIVFFVVFWYAYAGAKEAGRELIDVVRLFGGSRRHVLTKVVVPSASAWIFTGLQAAAPYAVVGAVVGEIIASNRGMGFLILQATALFQTDRVFAVIVVLMLVGVILNQLLVYSERKVLRWKSTAR